MPDMMKGQPSVSPMQMKPMDFIDQQRKEVHNSFVKREDDLRRQVMQDADFEEQMSTMVGEYDQAMGKFDPAANNMNNLQQLVASGQLNEQAAMKAQWNMILPSDVVDSMFPEGGDTALVTPESVAKTQIRAMQKPGLPMTTESKEEMFEAQKEMLDAIRVPDKDQSFFSSRWYIDPKLAPVSEVDSFGVYLSDREMQDVERAIKVQLGLL